MNRILIGAAALTLGLSSYAWAAGPEDMLGQPMAKVTVAPGAGKPAPARLAGARGVNLDAGAYARALDRLQPEGRIATRGANETRVYKSAAPAVVLVISGESFGSGALVGADGKIVTNLHVVGNAAQVGVVFKPAAEGALTGKEDIRMAKVIRRDGLTDLALIQVAEVPAGVAPLKVAEGAMVQVGADVHAIGHPTGEAWTYTRGIVSQVRRDYEWAAKDKVTHKATVIQTQTPINPGNSGGPLLDDGLAIVGINSFKGDGEGMNFAVSAEDVRALLAMTEDRAEAQPEACEIREISSERTKKPKGEEVLLDTDCDDKADTLVTVPDNKREPITYFSDSDGDGKYDVLLLDDGQDGDMDLALYDTDGNGKPDSKGYYRDGEDEPYRLEKITEK